MEERRLKLEMPEIQALASGDVGDCATATLGIMEIADAENCGYQTAKRGGGLGS
jgi:hypothetical protein